MKPASWRSKTGEILLLIAFILLLIAFEELRLNSDRGSPSSDLKISF
jgi:hypothetical protein